MKVIAMILQELTEEQALSAVVSSIRQLFPIVGEGQSRELARSVIRSLAEGGIVLFAATIAFIGSVVASLIRFVRSSPWTAGALASTAALCAHQLLDYIVFYPKAGVPWMIAIGLGLAASLRPSECAE